MQMFIDGRRCLLDTQSDINIHSNAPLHTASRHRTLSAEVAFIRPILSILTGRSNAFSTRNPPVSSESEP